MLVGVSSERGGGIIPWQQQFPKMEIAIRVNMSERELGNLAGGSQSQDHVESP